MAETDECRDCGAKVGSPHIDGCGAARCTACGWQRISCEHGDEDTGWGAIWDGTWPGHAEVSEGLARDLNDLHARARAGLLKWNGKRWVAAEGTPARRPG